MDRVMAAAMFNRICDLGSLSAVARALGLSHPMVSHYLDEMEKWTDAGLIHRSSRRLTITPAGEEALLKTRSLVQLLLDIGAASGAQIPSGTLRVACAHFTTIHVLTPVLPSFMEQYPQLRIEVEINNQPVSLVGERVDVAIHIAENPEPKAIARRLGGCKSVLCTSAGYLHRHGTPEVIDDLARHSYLYYNGFAGQSRYFVDAQGQSVSVVIKGNLSTGISPLLCESVASGMGVTLMPELEAQEGLTQGGLIQLLPEFQPEYLPVYGLCLSREHQSAGLRPLLDTLSEAQC